MSFEHYIHAGGRRLRCGYTTGTCAALAAAGATRLLLSGRAPQTVALRTPKGLVVEVPLEQAALESPDAAVAAVAKDAGDDVDVTDGLLVYARVERAAERGVLIDGGPGVGRVTKPGLDQPVGAAAINRVPRQMIADAVGAVREELAFEGGLRVTVFVPGAEALAERTFNPELGIVGGISILGTSGIVEPMSEQALVETVRLELRQALEQSQEEASARRLILTPGNYGLDFVRGRGLDRLGVPVVRCSNFVGEALDEVRLLGYGEVLLVGHAGKFVKLAGGIMNTHSRTADCRLELVAAHAAACGAATELVRALLGAATVDAAVALLRGEAGAGAAGPADAHPTATEARGGSPAFARRVLASLTDAAGRHVARRAGEGVRSGVVIFSNVYGVLGQTAGGGELMEAWR